MTEEDVRAVLREREQFRADGKWAEADGLREHLRLAGIVLQDTKRGPRWKPKGTWGWTFL